MGSCEIETARKLKRRDYLEKISKEFGDNEDISVDLLIDANCLEALQPVEFIPRQNDGQYAVRTALGWCVNFEIEKGCEDIGVKQMLKEIYMTEFNEPYLKQSQKGSKKYIRIKSY